MRGQNPREGQFKFWQCPGLLDGAVPFWEQVTDGSWQLINILLWSQGALLFHSRSLHWGCRPHCACYAADFVPVTLLAHLCALPVQQRQLRFPGLFAKLKGFPSGAEKQIRRDLHRTFPEDPLFAERGGPGQTSLFHVLNAHANFDARTGYMQGMAFVVGFLLRYVDEESAFWMFVSLMQDNLYKLRQLYGPGVGGFLMMMYQVRCGWERPLICPHSCPDLIGAQCSNGAGGRGAGHFCTPPRCPPTALGDLEPMALCCISHIAGGGEFHGHGYNDCMRGLSAPPTVRSTFCHITLRTYFARQADSLYSLCKPNKAWTAVI